MCVESIPWTLLLSDALHSTITMNTNLNLEGLRNPLSFDINIMDEDFGMVNELALLTSNIWKEMYVVLDSFFILFFVNEERKAHNTLSLMLDPRFKNLRLVWFLNSQEQKIILFKSMTWGHYFQRDVKSEIT